MKLASIIGLFALVGGTALGCGASNTSIPGFGDGLGGDDGGSSGATSSGSGSSGGKGTTSSSGGGSSSSGGMAPSDAGGGLQMSTQPDAATGDNPEIDYSQTKTV